MVRPAVGAPACGWQEWLFAGEQWGHMQGCDWLSRPGAVGDRVGCRGVGGCMVSPREEGGGGFQVLCSDISWAGPLDQSPKLAVGIGKMSLSLFSREIGLLGLTLWTRHPEKMEKWTYCPMSWPRH